MIFFDEERKYFHLRNENFSYVMELAEDKYLFHRYWGKALREFRDSAPLQRIDRGFSPQPEFLKNDRTFSLDVLPQEYPAAGHGDFRIPAYEIELADGTNVTELFYNGYKILIGKKNLQGLPATYADATEAETLEIELKDSAGFFTAILSYTIFKNYSVLCRSVRFKNIGDTTFRLKNAASAAIDFNDCDFESITLYGGHMAERNLNRSKLLRGISEISSIRGASSHQHSPFVALVRPETTEHYGEVFGFNLVYSGSFSTKIEVEQFGTTRLVMGLNPAVFSWELKPNEEFQTPEVVMVYGSKGLNSMSQTFHKLYRQNLMRGKYRETLRPILVNNWEATYFNFNEQKLEEFMDCAKKLGIELFVLDDGWFGRRNDDNSSLGDWFINREKLPHGLDWLSNEAHKRGLKFGLWFEPEMVSEDSELYRAHPDWILKSPNYPSSFSRNQLVLDLTRSEVRDYLVKAVCEILSSAQIDYVKWDSNRHLTESFSATLPAARQFETQHRHMLGLYEIMDRITKAFPEILFESCAGGGGRFDAGMLYYMPQTWASDNTDGICRLSIQANTALAFPPISMGAHVSVTPNHQVGRMTPLRMRALAAMGGTFGYELDICNLTAEEQRHIREHIQLYKWLRPTLQLGKFTRLITGINEYAWQFTSQDENQVVAMYFKILAEPATPVKSLKFVGLQEDAQYKVQKQILAHKLSFDFGFDKESKQEGKIFYGDELENCGLSIEKIDTDFAAYLWVLEKV